MYPPEVPIVDSPGTGVSLGLRPKFESLSKSSFVWGASWFDCSEVVGSVEKESIEWVLSAIYKKPTTIAAATLTADATAMRRPQRAMNDPLNGVGLSTAKYPRAALTLWARGVAQARPS